MTTAPICPYCNNPAELKSSLAVYGTDYDGSMVWECSPCDARVGAHTNSPTHKPKGSLANEELRQWRIKAHAAFDPLCEQHQRATKKTKRASTQTGYYWLSQRLGIPVQSCHIGMFDIDACKRAVDVCKNWKTLNVETSQKRVLTHKAQI